MLIDTYNKKNGVRTPAATTAIGAKFVDPAHIQVIQHVCEKHGFIATFRDAGKHSIKRIQAGSPCKPHAVLEKSIKEKSIADKDFVDVDLQDDVKEKVEQLNLWGLIGHWGKNGRGQHTLLGIRTVATHEPRKPLLDQDGKELETGEGQLYAGALHAAKEKAAKRAKNQTLSDPKRLKEVQLHQQYQTWVSLSYLERPPNLIPGDALTGDYDMHEMIHAKGSGQRGGRVISESPEEGRFSDLLNNAIFEAQEKRNQLSKTFHETVAPIENWPENAQKPTNYRIPPGSTRHNPYALIQHGPQHAYGAYIFAGGKEFLVECLLAYDVPIAAFGIPKNIVQQLSTQFTQNKQAVETGPILIEKVEELDALYKLLGVQGWDQAPKQFDDYLKFAQLNLGSMLRKQEEKAESLRETDEETARKQLVAIDAQRGIWDYWLLALRQQKIKSRSPRERYPSMVDKLKVKELLTDPKQFPSLHFVSNRVGRTDEKKAIVKKAWYADLEKWQPYVEWIFEKFIFRSIESFKKPLVDKKKKLEKQRTLFQSNKITLDKALRKLQKELREIPKERDHDIATKNNEIRRKQKELSAVKENIRYLSLLGEQIALLKKVKDWSTALKDDLLDPNKGLAETLSLSDEDDAYNDDGQAYGEDEHRTYETKAAFRTPAHSFAVEEPTYLNGMKVLFDQAVPVAPVVLIPKQQIPVLGGDTDDAPHPDGPPPALPRRVSGRQRLRYANRPDPLQRYRKTKQIEGYGYPEQDF